MRILPGVLKELMKHVPAVLFQTVEWSELMHEFPKLSRRMIQKEGYADLHTAQNQFLAPLNISLSTEDLPAKFTDLNDWFAETWLKLYFAQIFSPHGQFLDMRSHHISVEKPWLKWKPTGLWTKFSPEFRDGLIKVYDGFYLDDESLYLEGLEKIGLLYPEWPQEDKDELARLFKVHFGSGLTEDMVFDLENFKESILKVSDFLLRKKAKITKDFLYLGIYLVTLYSALEQTKTRLPVKKIYLEVRDAFKGQQTPG